ncbi:fe(2+) transport protein 1-like [Durio zibethinus]|uniref:Fe(2+) transport protein 1-like n=1 Tax=Durio zibethinus TaxID=66656 RepID=A0A6P6BF70_DURZI|nr:fe(2+) transport protein 1-like [Durio zibethinus]
MASSSKSHAVLSFPIVILILLSTPLAFAQCEAESMHGCHDKAEATKLKLIAIGSILVASMIGVCSPLLSRVVPAIRPERNLFMVVKAFASGVILATGYMHVLPDSFNDLMSDCLPENPWKKFPFTTFVAMLSALLTLMVDSFAMSMYKKRSAKALVADNGGMLENGNGQVENFGHGHGHGHALGNVVEDDKEAQLLRHRVIAQVLELGIVVHSVVIGLAIGASDNPCTIRPLIAAICFHQMFEGMGLGGCILQAEYRDRAKFVMAFFFATTTPFGIVLGIGLSSVYSETSPTALIVVGLLNACSAGLLNYMAMVDLLAAEFMGLKLQANMKLQAWAYIAVLLGAGIMALMAKWA